MTNRIADSLANRTAALLSTYRTLMLAAAERPLTGDEESTFQATIEALNMSEWDIANDNETLHQIKNEEKALAQPHYANVLQAWEAEKDKLTAVAMEQLERDFTTEINRRKALNVNKWGVEGEKSDRTNRIANLKRGCVRIFPVATAAQ